jgi:LysM repeat protein
MRLKIWLLLMLLWVLAGCQSADAALLVTPEASVTPTQPPIGVSLATRVVPTTAVIQTTPSPLPTSTTLPTATPIIYTIVDGDTLLGIAIQNRTTTEEIMALNPEVRPELLQIGQALILPPPATLSAQGVASTAVPIQVEVRGFQAYQTPVGGLWLLGEVVNLGDLPAGNVQVAVNLLSEAGEILATHAAWTAVPVILPGQSAPFGALVNEPPPDFARSSVSIAGGETLSDLGTHYVDLVVGETAVTFDESQVQVTGQVQNTGQSAAQAIVITATFSDGQGNVSGYQQLSLPDSLPPAESTTFTMTAAPPGGAAVEVGLTAHAQLVGE